MFFLLNLPLIAGQPDPNHGLFYIASKQEIQIDGLLDEWQEQVPILLNKKSQTKYQRGEWKGTEDLSAKCWISWNDSGLVIAAEVIDDSAHFPFKGHDVWENDCLQFAVDVLDDNNPDYYQNDDREFVVTWVDSQSVVYEYAYSAQRNSGIRNFPVQVIVTGDTIRYEVLIPWDGLGILGPFAGMHIGLSVVFFDNDGGYNRGWIEWTAGITDKKFTLPFATVLLFDPEVNFVQAIPNQTFLSDKDTVEIWSYSRYFRRNVEFLLLDGDDILFRKKISLKSRKWTRLTIPSKFLNWGKLKLLVNSVRISQQFDILVWSRQLITQQIEYLTQQTHILAGLKNIDATVSITVENWVEYLQNKLSRAVTDFDYYHVMKDAQKRVDQIPNFYMKRQVFYDRENRIVENFYKSENEGRHRRYLVYLPAGYSPRQKYPLYVFFHDNRGNEEESARKIGTILAKLDLPLIGVFPRGYPDMGLTHFGISELKNCLEHVLQKYGVEKEKIYLAGEGTGGTAALMLALRYPDRFAAVSVFFSKNISNFSLTNLEHTPVWLVARKDDQQADFQRENQDTIKTGGQVIKLSYLATNNFDRIMSNEYFDWILKQKCQKSPDQIVLEINHLTPSRAFWVEILGQQNYDETALFEANLDSNRLFVRARNLMAFSINMEKLPPTAIFPLKIFINQIFNFDVSKNNKEKLYFVRMKNQWELQNKPEETLEKTSVVRGPMAAIFDSPVKFVYSTQDTSTTYNKLTYQLAHRSCQRGDNDFIDKFLIADTIAAKQEVTTNLIVFGNPLSNVYLDKISDKLPIQIYQDGLKFGKTYYYEDGGAALYIYPNPQNPKYLLLVAFAPQLKGLKNIEKIWELSVDNKILMNDYVIFGNDVSKEKYQTWTEYGYFDHFWGTPWFEPLFHIGPQHWFSDILLGLDANQLSINSNWKGGGKSNFTWKIYARMEFTYQRQRYNWKNSIYCAFGQISVKEDEKWRSPEKSTDIIDFDSVLKFTLEKLIDPYIAFSLNTQFHEGYNPKTKQLVSRFANPLQLSQSAGMARNILSKKKLQLTTRVGYAAKEFITTEKQFRKLWTGDEAKWMKMDGGIEWLTETKSEFNKRIVLTNKLKLFQAIFSSISPQKDAKKNWRKLDIYWEHTFTAKLTQYVVFNAIIKFIYDRDTTPGGQFWENTSLGLSYKF